MGALGPVPTTNFPEPIGLAASFDQTLLHDVAAAISVEVRALHALGRKTGRLGRIGTGLDTWSPNINIFRDPRWGRGQETYGEDPFLSEDPFLIGWFGAAGHERAGADGYVRRHAAGTNSEMSALQGTMCPSGPGAQKR